MVSFRVKATHGSCSLCISFSLFWGVQKKNNKKKEPPWFFHHLPLCFGPCNKGYTFSPQKKNEHKKSKNNPPNKTKNGSFQSFPFGGTSTRLRVKAAEIWVDGITAEAQKAAEVMNLLRIAWNMPQFLGRKWQLWSMATSRWRRMKKAGGATFTHPPNSSRYMTAMGSHGPRGSDEMFFSSKTRAGVYPPWYGAGQCLDRFFKWSDKRVLNPQASRSGSAAEWFSSSRILGNRTSPEFPKNI